MVLFLAAVAEVTAPAVSASRGSTGHADVARVSPALGGTGRTSSGHALWRVTRGLEALCSYSGVRGALAAQIAAPGWMDEADSDSRSPAGPLHLNGANVE